MVTRRNFIKSSTLGVGLVGTGVLSATTFIRETNTGSKQSSSFCLLHGNEVPLIADVDVLVIGGTSGAIAAAAEAGKSGLSVFLAAPMPYPGEDICGTLRLWLENDQPTIPLAKSIFGGVATPFPLHVKTVLEDELLKHNISFLYSSYLVDVLYDSKGQLAGGVIANRSGRQAIRSRVVIDATLDAAVARSAGLLTNAPAGRQHYEYIVVGNSEKSDSRIVETSEMPTEIKVENRTYKARRYTFEFPDAGNDYAALSNIEQQIRDITWDANQVDSSDLLAYVPSQQIRSAARKSGITGGLQALIPANVPNLYLLNGYADLSREDARKLLRPVSLMDAGSRVGKDAAALAQKITIASGIDIRRSKEKAIKAKAYTANNVLRPQYHKGMLGLSDSYLPVLGEYDMVVLGGGTAGAPAGISGARHGIRTLTLEYLHGLGGLTTAGLIGRYWDGFREGFTKEVDEGVRDMAPSDHPRQKKQYRAEWPSDWKIEWFRKEIRKVGGDIWFGILGYGAVTDGKKVCGVVVATPYGRGVVLAKVVVDSTGSADVAIAASAQYDYTSGHTLAIQGAGLPCRNPDDFYNNTDWTFTDDTDIVDVSRVFVSGKGKYKGMYDLGKLPQTRERRRIIAEHNVSVLDVINGRRYPDTLSYHTSSFDTHGYTIDPYFTIKPPERRHKIYNADVPLRTLLPKGIDGLLVTGLGAGAHRDAMPIIRMQPCLQNQGYAVGYLVATAVKEKTELRKIDIKKIQKYLVSKGTLPERVLTDKDNFPLPESAFVSAAESLPNEMEGLEILLTDTSRAIPLLKQQLQQKSGTAEAINYAHTLSMLGDTTGLKALIAEVERFTEWDEGWPYTGMGQFGPCMSRLDSLIMALGATRSTEALPVIITHAKRLTLMHYFSHFRAVSVAFETIASNEAIPVLYNLLTIPGIRNNVVSTYQQVRDTAVPDTTDTLERNRVLKELHLARALYRCGDKDGLGASILTAYTNDLHNHYARHAKGVLNI